MRRDCRVRNDDVPRRQRRRQLPDDIQKSVVVRHKNLNVVAHLSQLGRCAHKVLDGSRVSIPDKHGKTKTTQIVRNPASDNAESDYANIFLGSTRHWGLRGLFAALAACSACGGKRHRAIEKLAQIEARGAAGSRLESYDRQSTWARPP